MNKLKTAFNDDQDMLSILDDREKQKMIKNIMAKSNDNFLESLKVVFKGDDGDTPVKGKDYFTAEEVKEIVEKAAKLATPKKFEDYFTDSEIDFIVQEILRNFKKEMMPVKGVDYRDGRDGADGKNGRDGQDYRLSAIDKIEIAARVQPPTIKDEKLISLIKPLIPEAKASEVDEEKFARKIVDIIRKKKLLNMSDVNGSFSKDGIMYRIEELMHGGGGSSGGSITYSYDLSSQCNGSNKVFTVPSNTNFVQLSGTDAPQIYRPTTDYTGSGTTTLTLTAAVTAPSNGATLILLYVV